MSHSGAAARNLSARYLKAQYSAPWTRPSDWVSLPTVTSSDETFVGLHAVYRDANFLALSASGNYTVDWGDGSATENISAGVTAYHIYDYTTYDVGNTTLCSRGYKQVIVTVTPQAGQHLTALNLNVKHNQTGLGVYSSGFLDIAISGQYLYDLRIGSSTPGASSQTITTTELESANIVRSAIRQCGNLFNGCNSLQNVTALSLYGGAAVTLACTFTDTGDLVTSVGHGLRDGDMVRPTSITSTAGITVGTIYYVVSSTADTFKLSATFGGTAVLLTTNGSGTLLGGANFSGTFRACYSLRKLPMFDTAAGLTFTSMFNSCTALQEVPTLDTSYGSVFTGMFYMCISLKSVPLLNTGAGTNLSSMLSSCYSLREVPLFNTALCTDFSGMFSGCTALKSIPQFNTAAGTTFASMFSGCSALRDVPLLNTASGTNFSSMFANCFTLEEVPALNTSSGSGTAFNTMFSGCNSLKSVPLLNTAGATSLSSMFSSCYSLQEIPALVTSSCTTFTSMFQSCRSIATIPALNTASGTNFNTMFNDCTGLREIPALNFAAGTSFTNTFISCFNIAASAVTGGRASIDYGSKMLSESALTTIIGNLGVASGTPTLTITNNYGTVTPVSLSGTTTAGSTIVTMASTTGITTGMQVTGTGTPSTTGISVTFTDSGDTVNLASHGLSNGDEVAFSAITTTTGIVINTIYFVVGSTANTFQVAATAGGAALPLTTDGSGTLKYKATVTAINPNVSVTLSRPTTSSGTNTLAFRTLKTNTALLKGWTVTG